MVPRPPRITTAIVLSALLLPLSLPAKPAAQFIWLSDVHFDPTANPKLVDALADANVHDWPRILDSSPPPDFGRFGADTNWLLLSSTLSAIRKTAPQAQFTIVTGDLLVHHFREKFDAAATRHDEEAYRLFSRKATQFVAAKLATLTPGKPVLFTLGNNDSDCGDYQLQPGGAFLNDSRAWFDELLGRFADQQANTDWTALGAFNVRHPVLKRYRILAVNSIYFAPRYRDTCAAGPKPDPAQQQMQWLERQLAKARTHKQKVWLILHIPPGVDGYATAHANTHGGPQRIVWLWKPQYTSQFQDLLSRYSGTVTLSLAGHTHMDDFRLLNNSVVLVSPAVSPVYLQNPAFRIVSFTHGGTLSDEKTYYLSNLSTAATGAPPDWKLEYDFDSTWNTHNADFVTLQNIAAQIEHRPAARQRWMNLYSVSAGDVITQQNFAWLFCASANVAGTGYQACVQRLQTASPN